MTQRREAILSFIVEYRKAGNGSPTLRELAEHFNVSIGTIQTHLAYLGKDGKVTVLKHVPRGIRVNE